MPETTRSGSPVEDVDHPEVDAVGRRAVDRVDALAQPLEAQRPGDGQRVADGARLPQRRDDGDVADRAAARRPARAGLPSRHRRRWSRESWAYDPTSILAAGSRHRGPHLPRPRRRPPVRRRALSWPSAAPKGLDDIRPFLANVLRGRRIPPARDRGGGAPLRAVRRRLADHRDHRPAGARARRRRCAQARARAAGPRRHAQLAAAARRHAAARCTPPARAALLVLIAAAHRSYSSCEQYKQNLWQVQEELAAEGLPPFDVAYAGDWHTRDGVLEAVAERIDAARATLPAGAARPARGWCSPRTRSRPRCPPPIRYVMQLRDSAAAVAALVRAHGLGAGLPEPQRASRGSVARAGRERLPARGARGRPRGGDPGADRLPRRSRRGALRPRRRGARDRRRRSGWRWPAPRRSTTIPGSSRRWRTW